MKNRVIKYCQDNNIEVEIQKDYDDKRKIEKKPPPLVLLKLFISHV